MNKKSSDDKLVPITAYLTVRQMKWIKSMKDNGYSWGKIIREFLDTAMMQTDKKVIVELEVWKSSVQWIKENEEQLREELDERSMEAEREKKVVQGEPIEQEIDNGNHE